ncbi:hypothetical protein [Paenirhodobacter populi]|uniref:Uncharacterized protein n=1 Tax=Paenirhodobacter populi TaxID=2306993 RepID=A0A443JDU5_9RHOB|nr:hypothetical protein [Sinirhodobacter populi]RWR18513.1 hypothetical protein D2T30_16110 [Sinirhodobacter populi]
MKPDNKLTLNAARSLTDAQIKDVFSEAAATIDLIQRETMIILAVLREREVKLPPDLAGNPVLKALEKIGKNMAREGNGE